MKLDIYKNEQKYLNWKENVLKFGIEELNKINSNIILKYIFDMEVGKNVSKSSKKGSRSFSRLNSLRNRIMYITKILEDRKLTDLTKLKSDDVIELFNDMRNGKIKRKDGTNYNSVADYVKDFKSFWNWYMKIKRAEGIIIQDITEDLDKRKAENTFVYLEYDDVQKMLPYFNEDQQVRILFMFDTIIRSPGELKNIKVYDLSKDCKELNIRTEISKIMGRRIKILYCSEELKRYIKRNNLKDDDYLFQFEHQLFNNKLQRVAKELFGEFAALNFE